MNKIGRVRFRTGLLAKDKCIKCSRRHFELIDDKYCYSCYEDIMLMKYKLKSLLINF